MSKDAERSLTRFGDKQLHNLHSAIRKWLPALVSGELKESLDASRKGAFSGSEYYRLFKHRYLRSQVLKKYQKGTITADARVRNAVVGLLESEEGCRAANGRLYDAFNRPSADQYIDHLGRAKRIIAGILGTFDAEVFIRCCSFSSGATTEFRRGIAAVPTKWETGTHITERALPWWLAFQRWSSYPLDRSLEIVKGNVVFTVPKNYEKDRACAKEPTLNMFLQKGVGGYIRARLQKVGLLHADAQWRHMVLAKQASIDGIHTTDDLAAASDSISLSLCQLLLPDDWFKVLMDLRSQEGVLPDGSPITYEKISSMGNGFTFELETMLFYALVKAVCGKDGTVSVYGDDLIYPSSHVETVRKLLCYCGFSTNVEKSFSTGPFRESCGGHYFNGNDVTPFYLHAMPTTYGEIIELHNNIISYHTNMPPNHRMLRVARECRKLIPRSFWGPMGTSGVIWSEWDEARPRYNSRKGYFEVKAILREVVEVKHDYFEGSLMATLWQFSEQRDCQLHLPGLKPELQAARYRRGLREYALRLVEPPEMSFIAVPLVTERFGRRWVGSTRWTRLPVAV